MISVADKMRDAVQAELMGAAAALKPPDSNPSLKHLPDPQLLAELITQVLLPILTSVAAGIFTHIATTGADDATQRKLDELTQELKGLEHRREPEEDAVVDAVVRRVAELPFDTAKLGIGVEADAALKVAAELRRFHLSSATSTRLAPIIVERVLAVLSSAAGGRS